MSAQGKVVVITGASSGLGAALAELLAGRGAKLALVARREKELKDVAARCGADALPIVADVARREEVKRVVSTAIRHFGRIDVWVNNAGRAISRMPTQLTDEDVQEMMQVNVMSAFYGMQEVLPHFKERGEGHVINISSLLGRVPFALIRSAYSASKHYLNALTALFRDELRSSHPGIRISLVSPGVVATDFGLSARHGGPDSRTLPGAQPVGEVAEVIATVIDTRRADAYTQPHAQRLVADYYANPNLGEHP
jgi:NAD(P)-dependent dehydrogenase (short-subunit alcohol dehydrogenase family)